MPEPRLHYGVADGDDGLYHAAYRDGVSECAAGVAVAFLFATIDEAADFALGRWGRAELVPHPACVPGKRRIAGVDRSPPEVPEGPSFLTMVKGEARIVADLESAAVLRADGWVEV